MARRRGRPRQGHAKVTPPERPPTGALARGLAILHCFRAEDQVIGTQEIARRTGLPKATVSRLANTLTELGYLRFVPAVGKYALSSQVLTLGYAALGRSGISELARPFIQDLIASGDCAVAISIRDELDMMFVELARKPSAVLLNLTVGARVPMLYSAPGRAYLAAIDDEEREKIYARLATREGARWSSVKRTVGAVIEQARRQGFAEAIGSWRAEHNAIGVAIRDPLTGEMYTLSLGGLASVLTRDRLVSEFAPQLLKAAETISSQLQGLG